MLLLFAISPTVPDDPQEGTVGFNLLVFNEFLR